MGHRETVIQQSVRSENGYVHVVRAFIDALHSTKGWRRIRTGKTIEKIEKRDANTQRHITQIYTRR